MDWDVISVKPLAGHRIHVALADGRQGVFDLTPYLDHGVFRELRTPQYFAQVAVVLGAVSWPHGQDIAPETLLAGLQRVSVATAPA
jgi:hypothetical protein